MEARTNRIPRAVPHNRRKNFTLIEKKYLFSLTKKFRHILDSKIINARMNNKKNEIWDRITEIYNCLPGITDISSKKQLHHLYQNTKKIAKRKNIVEMSTLLEIKGPSWESMDSTVTLDGYDPIDKRLLQIVPLPSSSDNDNIIRNIKCEVIEDDHTDNSPCIVSSNSTDSAVISTPSDENDELMKKVLDIIENSSNSTDCAVTSTPPEEDTNKKVQEIIKKSLNTTSSSATPLEEQTICINDNEVQLNNEHASQASSSHPTSTTTPLGEQLLTSYKKKSEEPASKKAADALYNQTVARTKQLEEEHELIKKKLHLEIDFQIAQHKSMMERMKRENEQSEKLYAAKLRALEAKARYFENKMNME